MDGQPIRRVLEWLLNREIIDADIAAALELPASTYSRRKDDDDFPSYPDLYKLGAAFGLDARMLQIAFEWRQQHLSGVWAYPKTTSPEGF